MCVGGADGTGKGGLKGKRNALRLGQQVGIRELVWGVVALMQAFMPLFWGSCILVTPHPAPTRPAQETDTMLISLSVEPTAACPRQGANIRNQCHKKDSVATASGFGGPECDTAALVLQTEDACAGWGPLFIQQAPKQGAELISPNPPYTQLPRRPGTGMAGCWASILCGSRVFRNQS